MITVIGQTVVPAILVAGLDDGETKLDALIVVRIAEVHLTTNGGDVVNGACDVVVVHAMSITGADTDINYLLKPLRHKGFPTSGDPFHRETAPFLASRNPTKTAH